MPALLALSTAAPVLAQTMAPSLDQPVTITFYNYNLATAGLGADATQKLIDEFMEANPNVTVEGIGYSSADGSRIEADWPPACRLTWSRPCSAISTFR
ncbi:hypothetical protein [Devosia ginsengisoli]|uniref:hypothetical protein n=1 Tax=Devosia ginsengisoli TaxID=400770 RepID=UPI0026F2C2D5|nr:hypothetical protein [Devosia ginsengisoli]MCR6673985.1 hypothetical protein [Devosia ginsengisoli]